MAKNLGNELFKIYCRLWYVQKDKEFNFQKALEILNTEIKHDNEIRVLSSYFSKIKKYGWMEVRLDPVNSRIRLYKLRNPKDVVEESGKAEYHFKTER